MSLAGRSGPERRPRLRAGVRVVPAPGGCWQARWDFDEVAFLDGDACERTFPWLIPLLDGGRTVEELLALAPPGCPADEVDAALLALEETGLLDGGTARAESEAPATVPAGVAATVCGGSPLAGILAGSLAACGFPPPGRCTTRRELELLLGTRAPEGEERRPILAVVETDWQPQDLEAVNTWSLARGAPWLLLAAWNRRVLVGPLFLPGEGPCHECYRGRLGSPRRHGAAYRVLETLRRAEPELPRPEPLRPPVAALAAALAAAELLAFATGAGRAHALGSVVVYQPDEARLAVETLLRIPWCPACSEVRGGARACPTS